MEFELELERDLARARVAAQLFGGATDPVRLGRFEILRQLGRGAMGAVYEALDRERGGCVALKLLSRVDAAGVYRLKREFRSLVAISHRNLVALDELFCERGVWFFSMELVAPAVPFDAWARSAGDGGAPRLRDALAQLTEAVRVLHGEGKLHCDLKPSNVLVTAEGRVVLLDFGLVTDAVSVDTLRTGLTGTPAYLAPEQAQGDPASEASDWYALGVILFEALTGRLPFAGNPLQVLQAKQTLAAPRARDLLRDEYDIAQVADLCALCDALLARNPAQRPAFEQLWTVVSNNTSPPPGATSLDGNRDATAWWLGGEALFVGREPELAAMREALADVRKGTAVSLLLSGSSGVGKSALLDRFVSELDGTALVLRGRCHEQESVPYKVFDDVVDGLARHLRLLPATEVEPLVPRRIQSLLRLFPTLGRVAAFARRASPGASERDARELRNEAFAALNELLLRLTDIRPVVIVVDDLQWGDVDSARMIEHSLAGPEPPPLLLLGAFRSNEVERSDFLTELLDQRRQGSSTAPRLLHVGPLPQTIAEDLARELLKREGLKEQIGVAAALAREAEGLAFFIGELVRHHAASAAREQKSPLSLERAILERVAELPPTAQELLRVVSVAGAPLEQSAALRAARLTPDERRALNALKAARLLRRHAGHPADAIETYHDRVRETVVGQLDQQAVRSAHSRIAEALEALEVSDPERLVMHHARAGDRVRAAARAGQAAQAAMAKLAFNRAAKLLRTAIDLSSDAAERRALQQRLGDALVNAGRGAEAANAYLSAADGCDAGSARELQRLAAMHYLRSGRTAQGLALARSVFDAVGLSLPGSGVRAVGAYVWQRARLQLRRLSGKRLRTAASAAQLERLDCLLAVFPELSFNDPLPGAVLQAQFLSEALAAGEPQRLLQGLVFEVFNLALLGDARGQRRAHSALELARRVAHDLRTPYARAMVNLAEASYHLWSGRAFHSALLPCVMAQQGFAEVGSTATLERGLAAFMHFTALEFTGGLAALCAGGLRMLHEAEERDDHFVAMLTLLSVPYAYAMGDRAEEGLRLLRDQEAHFPPGYTTFRHLWMIRMADTLNYLDRPDEALAMFARHWSSFLSSSHHRCTFARDAIYAYRARCALISYLARKDPAMIALVQHDMRRLRQSPTIYRCTVESTRAALLWDAGNRPDALRMLEQTLPRFRANDGESFYIYAQLAHARLSGDDGKHRELVAKLREQGVQKPERWAWITVPIGPRP